MLKCRNEFNSNFRLEFEVNLRSSGDLKDLGHAGNLSWCCSSGISGSGCSFLVPACFLWKTSSFQVLDTNQKQMFESRTIPKWASFQTAFSTMRGSIKVHSLSHLSHATPYPFLKGEGAFLLLTPLGGATGSWHVFGWRLPLWSTKENAHPRSHAVPKLQPPWLTIKWNTEAKTHSGSILWNCYVNSTKCGQTKTHGTKDSQGKGCQGGRANSTELKTTRCFVP